MKEAAVNFESVRLRRRLFGYKRDQVEHALSQREGSLLQAEGRVRAAEARVAELEQELSSAKEELEARESMTGTAKFLTEELSTILGAAEESATRIMERARTSTQQQIEEADRMWRDMQAEITRFASWRDRLDPALQTTRSRFDEVRSQVQEIPERIRRALAPMADAIAGMDSDLATLASAFNPPLLLAPSGLEERAGVRREPEAGASEEEPAEGTQDTPEASNGDGAEEPPVEEGADGKAEDTTSEGEAPEGEASSEAAKEDPASTDQAPDEPAASEPEENPPPAQSKPDIFGRTAQSPSSDDKSDPPVSDYLPPSMGIA